MHDGAALAQVFTLGAYDCCTGFCLTLRWSKPDSNHRSRSRKRGAFWSWLRDLRSCRAQPAEALPVSSPMASHEPGDFLIEALHGGLHIDRGLNALLAVRHGPAHPSPGKEYSQPDSRPVVLEAAVASEDPPHNAISDQRLQLYGARGNLLREMLAERLQADRLAGLWVFDQQTNFGFRHAVADHGLDPVALLRCRLECRTAH